MLDKEKFNYFYNIIKLDFLKGKFGKPVIPADFEIFKKLKPLQIVGPYFDFPNVKLDRSKTNIKDYNNNLLNIKHDFNVIFRAINNSINEVEDQFKNSIAERNKALKELDIIENEIDLIQSRQSDPALLEYYFSDSFNNTKFIDFNRSKNILFDPDKKSIKLDLDNANRIDFSHYLNRKGIYFNITSDTTNILSQNNLPNTRFDAIFTESDTDRWVYEILTSDVINIQGYIELQLSSIGSKEKINRISIKFAHLNDVISDSNRIFVEYKRDNEWVELPETFKLIDRLNLDLSFQEIKTDAIRIHIIKTEPDDIENLAYYIGIQELNVFNSENKFEGLLYSKAIDIEPYSDEELTVYSAILNTIEDVPEETKVNYYVATDDLITGKIVNINGEIVDINSTDAYAFVANDITNIINGDVESFSIYASELREHYYLSGAAEYENWEPNWVPIKPKNRNNNIPDIQYFDTSTEFKDVHNVSIDVAAVWGDATYTGPWPYRGSVWASGAPMTGYIWGESIFTAGLIWGQNNFTTGWWRRKPPDISGVLTDPSGMLPALPDFQALGKEFYRIFLWRKGETPLLSSIKLFNNFIEDNNKWFWNYEEKNVVRKIVLDNIEINNTDNLYVIDDEGINAKIQMGSVQNVHLLTSPENLVEDTDYLVRYYTDLRNSQTGVLNKVTLDFNDYIVAQESVEQQAAVVMNNESFNRVVPRDVYIEYEVEQTERSISTWNTFLYINSELPDPFIQIGTELEESSSLVDKIEISNMENVSRKLVFGKENLNRRIFLNPGWYKLRIFTDAYIDKLDQRYGNPKWNPIDTGNFILGSGIRQFSALKPLDVIDFFSLLYDRHAEDETKCSVIKDIDDTTYLVVQKPSAFRFPGYDNKGVFQQQDNYEGISNTAILNNYHYRRNIYDYNARSNTIWTTGSSGIYTYASEPDATTVSDGKIDLEFPNNDVTKWYPNINTFGEYINVHNPDSSGFLFYESGENLESYYSISYRIPNENKSQRIFIKAELNSEDKGKTPVLNKYDLTINHSKFKEFEVI